MCKINCIYKNMLLSFGNGNIDLFTKSLFPNYFSEVSKILLLYGEHIIVFVTESLRIYKEYFSRSYKA